MRRRDVLASLGAVVVARAHVAFAQAAKTPPEIAVLMPGRAEDPADQALLAALRSGLAALRWEEGKTVRIEYRWWGETDDDRIRAHAAELVRGAPSVIVILGAPAIALRAFHSRSRALGRCLPAGITSCLTTSSSSSRS